MTLLNHSTHMGGGSVRDQGEFCPRRRVSQDRRRREGAPCCLESEGIAGIQVDDKAILLEDGEDGPEVRPESMSRWKVIPVLRSPNGMQVNSNNPKGVIMAILAMSSAATGTCR